MNFTSAPLVGHSPLAVDGLPCPANCEGTGAPTNTCASDGEANVSVAAAKPNVDTDNRNFRDIVSLPGWRVFY